MAPYAVPALLYGTGAGYAGSMAGLSEEMMPDLAEAALYHKTSQVSGLGAAVTVIAGLSNPDYYVKNNQVAHFEQVPRAGEGKTIDDIINNLPETTNGKGVARNFESTGGFERTIKDFDSLNPIDVKEIQTQYGTGKVGKLSDGTTVVARQGSTTGGATLEIKVSNSKVYKIRY